MKKLYDTLPMKCLCENCDKIGNHVIGLLDGYSLNGGDYDFFSLRCENCSKITICYPNPFPESLDRSLVEELVKAAQKNVNENC